MLENKKKTKHLVKLGPKQFKSFTADSVGPSTFVGNCLFLPSLTIDDHAQSTSLSNAQPTSPSPFYKSMVS